MTDPTPPFDQMPQYLVQPGNESLINQMKNRLQEYRAQELVLSLFKELDGVQGDGPDFGVSVSIDTDDGIYFLYYEGAEGVEIDEGAFENDALADDYRDAIHKGMEGLTQWMNDQECVQDKEKWFERSLVEALNEVSWQPSDRWEAASETMNKYGWDGDGFAAAVQASQINALTQPARSTGMKKRSL
jgi:hypothetical protein